MMAAEEAVFTAAVARDEVRKSLMRMEYHMSRGPAGLRGVTREQNFLDALGRQSARLGAGTAGGVNVGAKAGLGTRARAALIARQNGNGVSAGRFRSSLLAEFSQDTMSGAREWTYDGKSEWVWVSNASACPACLDQHGKRFKGAFVPMHPSCLCFPQDPQEAAANGVQPLTEQQLVDTLMASNNAAFASVGEAVRSGRMSIAEAAEQATRRSAKGLARWQKTITDQRARAQRIAEDTIFGPVEVVAPEPTVPANIVDDLPTKGEIVGALDEVEVEQFVLRPDGAKITYKAKKHQAIIDEVERRLNQVIDHPGMRAKLRAALDNLTEFRTYSNAQQTTVGRFKWWGRPGHSSKRAIEVNMRRMDPTKVAEYNAAMDAANAAAQAADDLYRAAEITPLDYQQRINRIKRNLPDKKSLYIDSTVDDVVDTLVHEGFHAIDEATGFKLGSRAAREIQKDVQAIYHSSDPNARAFQYAAELRPTGRRGVETAAEMVRMYFMGTGEQATSAGIAPISAAEWRRTYPKLAAWVEDILA